MPELDWSEMPIHQAIKADWKTPELLIEGSLGCAKTTVGLDKEIDALLKWPGIPILLFRWSQDAVDTKLRVAFEELLSIRQIPVEWDGKRNRYTFENGSTAYAFGLKSVSVVEQFNKIRGLGVSRIFGDQVEEMAQEVAGELRGRLRPDLTATMTGRRFPFQLTFVANPSDLNFWLSKEFPEDNRIKGRKLYSLSIFDNRHLPPESVESLIRQFPPEHPKNLTMVMGRRGPHIIGVPVYEGLYKKELHHAKPTIWRPDAPVLEAFEFGKHNPCFVFGQATYAGGLMIHGGIAGQELALEDFLPIVKQYRKQWYPKDAEIQSCTGPTGSFSAMVGSGFSSLDILSDADIEAIYNVHGNSKDVRLSLIEHISGMLRRRTPGGEESIVVNTDPEKWLTASRQEVRHSAFVHISLEAGYVWDKYFASVANKEVKQPHEDDNFANAMHCVENIVLNFCAGQLSEAEKDERDEKRAREDAMNRIMIPQSELGWLTN